MMSESKAVAANLERRIVEIRGVWVLVDVDLASIYGVTTKAFNQAIQRNAGRFPADFAFRLTQPEFRDLRSQFVTSTVGWGGRRYPPWVFTEHGAIMAATVLRSSRAVEMSIFVVRAFVRLRDAARRHGELARHLAALEQRVTAHDGELKQLFTVLRRLVDSPPPGRRRIGFGGREEP